MNSFNGGPTNVNGDYASRAAEKKRLFDQKFFNANAEMMEHVFLIGAIKSYKFYTGIKERLCPRLPDGRTFRPDFTRSDFNLVYEITARFWESVGFNLKEREMAISADLMDVQISKRVEQRIMAVFDANILCEWLINDIRTIEVDPGLLQMLPDNPMFKEWIEGRAADYERRRLDPNILGRSPTLADLKESVKSVERTLRGNLPVARRLCDIPKPPPDDPNELINHRFLCRGAGMLLCGGTGLGKSVFDVQCSIAWGAGKPCMGIVPARPLKSLIIQAEDDDGDLAEIWDGVCTGLKLTPQEFALAQENVIVVRENSRVLVQFFLEVVEPLLRYYRPDVLHINPALAYLGGEANSQKDVGTFLRNQLNPLLIEYQCGVIVIHHTNKPTGENPKSNWKPGDFAYLGSGSIEWANWARGILALRPTDSPEVFQLLAPKRGMRLGWKAEDGFKPSTTKLIAHSGIQGKIFWKEAGPGVLPSKGRPKSYDLEEILGLLPPEGWEVGVWAASSKTEYGVSESTFHNARRELQAAGRVVRDKETGKWRPVTPAPAGPTGNTSTAG